MKTIGILGGLGPESTAAYYNYITRKYYELKHDYAYPQIIINSLSFKPVIDEKYTCAPMVAQAVQGPISWWLRATRFTWSTTRSPQRRAFHG